MWSPFGRQAHRRALVETTAAFVAVCRDVPQPQEEKR
jgi:hypothetical protein